MRVRPLLLIAPTLLAIACTSGPPPVDLPPGLDLDGEWVGVATAAGAEFPYRWELEQTGDRVSGIIHIQTDDGSQRASYRMRGSLSNGALLFEGVSFIERVGLNWCMASGRLRYLADDGRHVLVGRWGPLGIPGGCPLRSTGGVRLSRPIAP